MNTVHRSPRRIGASLASAISANCFLIAMSSSSARSSRKLPVPAAHASFIVKSTTTPSCSEMYLASCPPISKIVSGSCPSSMVFPTNSAPVLCAVISSLIVSAPTSSPISSRPDPVVPTPPIVSESPHWSAICDSAPATTSIGRPIVGVYISVITRPDSSITTTLVETLPMSIPRYAFTGGALLSPL